MVSPSSKKSSSSQPDGDDRQMLLLEQELERAKAELAEYQALINQTPSIYETKFRQQVHGLALDIRRLLEERRSLQQQLSAASDLVQARFDRPAPRRLSPWRLGLVRRLGAPARRLAQQSGLPLLTIGTATAVALLVVGADALGPRTQVSRRPSPPEVGQTEARTESKKQAEAEFLAGSTAKPQLERPLPGKQDLRLRAAGPCWVEVRTASGKVVLAEQLKKGDQRSFPLADGLRVRAGRPDLLRVAVAGDDFRALAAINHLGWKTFLPSQTDSAPPSPSLGGQ